ncbi:MAG: asparagine synthase (glutamine-hydrolyzing) [Candidatus Woesearchaeota archaeon]|jgi:asparagine synthase (glutamine-hydrolysing)
MCGINGILDLKKQNVDPQLIKIMCSTMIHRGPDGEGIYTKNEVGLGQRRLAIIDLSDKGKQPMLSNDENLAIVFNGEIYNYEELMIGLKKKGVKFKSHSDTEVILKLYEQKGIKLLDDLRGMFAFAIWDAKKKQLFIARDRFGEKPLLYGTFDNKFYFASEINAILQASKCKREINLEALHLYLLYNLHHVPEPYSIIKGINKLMPGSYMLVSVEKNKAKIEIRKYWTPNYSNKSTKNEQDLLSEYRHLAKECINLREVADVPVSAFLSGGVDSSTIVGLMNSRKGLETYSMGFDKKDPELVRARKVSKLFNTKNHETIFKKEFLKKNKDIIKKYGEPYSLMPAIYSYVLCESIKKKFKVALAGNGADEMFYGYGGSNGLLLLTKLEKITPRFLPFIADKLIPNNITKLKNIKMSLKILSSKKSKQKGAIYRYYGLELRKKLYSDKTNTEILNFDEGELVDSVVSDCNSPHLIERFYHAGLFMENAHSTTIIADVTGMAHSIEVRSPFLDHKMAEFAAKLPLKYKVRSFRNPKYNKYIMKKSMEDILPQDILYGKKMGFGYNIKVSDIIKNDFKREIETALLKDLPKLGLFKEEYLKKILQNHINNKEDNSQLIWALYNFNVWHKEFMR